MTTRAQPLMSNGVRPLRGLVADLRSAVRMLRHERGFAALVVFTLALGIGSTAAVFGMADQLLLRPLPGVHDDGRAAYLRLEAPGGVEKGLTTPEFDELRRTTTSLDGIASYFSYPFDASAGGVHGVHADVAFVYGDYFDVLGVRPASGQLLRASDTDFDSDARRAVISERMAKDLFGSTGTAVGRPIYLNNQRVMVVGVAGARFSGAERDANVDVWLPLAASAPLFGDPIERLRGRTGAPHSQFVTRLRRGVSFGSAATELRTVLGTLARDEPAYDHEARLMAVTPTFTRGLGLSPDVRARVESVLRLLAGVVALVLVIACANVANLLLFRNVARRSAVTTRMALGAPAVRIAREHFVHSLILGAMGAAVGIGVGWIVSLLFRGQVLANAPALAGLPLDARVAVFAVLASIGTALLFGTLPAALAGRFDLASALRQTDVRHSRRMAALRSALSSGQLALTLTLGVGALLLVRTVNKLNAASTGLEFRGVASLEQSHKTNMDRAQTDVLARRVMAALQNVPGVQVVGLGPPDLDASSGIGKTTVGLPGAAPEQRVDARIVPVTPSWFTVFHIKAVRGRVFGESDWKEGEPYNAVLTASLARKLFGTEDAVDRTLGGFFGRPEVHIVGVVPNLSGNQAPDVPKDVVFVTYAFPPVTSSEFDLVFRVTSVDASVNAGIRSALSAMLPDQPVEDPALLSSVSAHKEQATLSQLLVLLSTLAAILATVGLYGVIAFIVAGRRREFAIRIALGAVAWRIGRLIFQHAAVIVVTGTVLGVGGAYVLSRALQNRLFEVGPFDPASYLAGAALLALVAVIACVVPARRAVKVDPVTTLREE